MGKPGGLAFPTPSPFVDHLGLVLHRLVHGEAELGLVLRPEHLNTWQIAHGGVLATLLDVSMAHAARSLQLPPGGAWPDDAPIDAATGLPQLHGVVTLELKINYLLAAEGELRAVANVLGASATHIVCDASAFNAQGQRCAHATASFKPMKAMPSRGPDGRLQVRPLNQA